LRQVKAIDGQIGDLECAQPEIDMGADPFAGDSGEAEPLLPGVDQRHAQLPCHVDVDQRGRARVQE